jgi:hypothetical protein
MPTKPEGAHLTGVRTWLAGQITAFKAGNNLPFNDFDQAIKLVVAHGTVLGLPSGDTGKQGVLALITPNGDVSFGSACAASDDESGTFMAFGGGPHGDRGKSHNAGRPGSESASKPVNDCEFCPAFACRSRTNGGKSKCICLHDSSFDLTKLSKGLRGFVAAHRAYHKQNPNVATLKDVKLTIRREGEDERVKRGDGDRNGEGKRIGSPPPYL